MNRGGLATQGSATAPGVKAAAARNRQDFRDSGSARDGNVLARRGNRGSGHDVRVVIPCLRCIYGRTDRADLAQAHLRNRIKQAGINLQAFGVNHLSACGDFHAGADGSNLAVTNDQRAVFDWRTCESEYLCVRNRISRRRLRLSVGHGSKKEILEIEEAKDVKQSAKMAGLAHSAPL